MEEIYFNEEAKDKLFNGIEKLYKAVSSTLGPNGKTVTIVDSYNNPIVTKDGVSVARAISFKDFVENAGAELIKQAAERTLIDVGDNTTTSIVLAYSLIKNLKEFDYLEVNKLLDEIIPKVIQELKNNSRDLKHENIKHVATISANNDKQIGELIQQAFDFSNIVKVEESNNIKDSLELVDGMKLENVTYFSKNFTTNNSKTICEYENVHVLVINGKVEKLDPLLPVIEYCHSINKPLLIITEHINQPALTKLEAFKLSNQFKVCVINAPGFSSYRKDLLRDISDFTNSTLIEFIKPITKNDLGTLESFKVTSKDTLLVKDKNVVLDELILSLKEFADTLEGTDKDLITKRIENLTAKISIIKVGGNNPIEVKERYDRYDDAIRAVSSGLEEGIVEGGGVALARLHIKLNLDYILPDNELELNIYSNIINTILHPLEIINKNGYKITTLDGNMFDLNIIDTLKGIRCALENAVSVTKIILSTETVILDKYLWSN